MRNAVATRQQNEIEEAGNGNPLVALRNQLEQRASEFKMALPAHITPEKFQRTILTAVQQNPDLLKCDRRSFITSCMKAAQDGLLPDGREAALVKFLTRQKDANGEWRSLALIQYMPMVYGLRKKILQSGEVKDIQANVVYRQEVEAGLFIYEEGTERMLRHKPCLDPDFDPVDDDICAAYSVATYADGSQSFEVMRRSEINKVRETSQTGATRDRNGKAREPKGPWVDWFSEMAKKTVMRRHSKTLPMSGDILDVEAMDEALAARSAVHMLGSTEPDEAAPAPPRRIDHDPETGEIIEISTATADDGSAGEADGQPEAEEVAASASTEGRDDSQMGEQMTLADAKAEIDGCELAMDVNARVGALLPLLSEEDGDELRTYAAERIDGMGAK